MTTRFLLCVFTLLTSFCSISRAAETGTLIPQLEPLRPFLGKTWRGEFKGTKEPTVDISRWERALNGQAVRILHSVNEGSYGGETIIYFDKEKQGLVYNYFTTAGFQTSGSFTNSGGKFISSEKVKGNASGITEVRATSEFQPDGSFINKAEYLKDGKVSGGREVVYKEDPKAEVKFK